MPFLQVVNFEPEQRVFSQLGFFRVMALALHLFKQEAVIEMKRTFLELKQDDSTDQHRARAFSDFPIHYSCSGVATSKEFEACSGVDEDTDIGHISDLPDGISVMSDETLESNRWSDCVEVDGLCSGPPGVFSSAWAPVFLPVVAQRPLTTVMLRNLPNSMTREMLMDLLDENGFKGRYDFLYLPLALVRKRHTSLGYAFLNLLSTELANDLYEAFHGFMGWGRPSQKVCEVSWSHVCHGLEEHVHKFRNSDLMHSEVPDKFRPILLRDGERVTFPAPTRHLQPPIM